jgi:hypothetical protein
MLPSIQTLIRRFHGRIHEVAGVVIGYFDDPFQTYECAHEIELRMHRKVELCGCQICVSVDSPLRGR